MIYDLWMFPYVILSIAKDLETQSGCNQILPSFGRQNDKWRPYIINHNS